MVNQYKLAETTGKQVETSRYDQISKLVEMG